MNRARLRRRSVVALAGLLVAVPATAGAVLRTCVADPVANTASVLCASPSGPCTATGVTMSANIEVTAGGCVFDLGGRALSVQKTLQMTGLGFITVTNAGDVAITATGQLKARGDFVKPQGWIIQGGGVTIVSAGTITHAGTIDVTGDGAGTIRLDAAGDVFLQGGSVIQGNGVSSFTDEGERYADGGTFDVVSRAGEVTVAGTIAVRGGNQATGGLVDLQAASDVALDGTIDATGGGGDGGEVSIYCGDDVTITKKIDVSSRVGGGFGGLISLAAGADTLGGVVPGGSLTVDDTTIELNGSDAETFGGDGGELDASAMGALRIIGSRAAIRANAGTLFDGSGGVILLDSGDISPHVLGPLDGDLRVEGQVVARSGGLSGDGGVLEMSAGRALTLAGSVTVTGRDSGGEVVGDAGGAIDVSGAINAGATNAAGDPGYVDLTAGLAQDATLMVASDILAAGGASSGSGQSISLAGCGLIVGEGVKVNGRAGISPSGIPGGSDIDLIARKPMQLRANSQYLANPGGRVTTIHPPGQNPVIGAGVVFDPVRIDNPAAIGPYPNCPVCGDSTRQAGEGCDDGNLTGGDGCSPTCTIEPGWNCTGQPSACEPVCGDAVVLADEECDDGNIIDGDGCDSNCTITGCGNAIVTAGEQCDDGATQDGDGCSATCAVEPGWNCTGQPSVCVEVCGDGVRTGDEACDDGNLTDGDGCDSNCTPTACGNGILTAGEQCDDGGTAGGDCCSAGCQFEPAGSLCGDDGNVCTDDLCDGAGGCARIANTAPCVDGNACTTADTCSGGSCVGGQPPNCDDGNVCTNDGCNPAVGCVHAPNANPCDDGAFCTVIDRCEDGSCVGDARDCGDGNQCTADSCDEAADRCLNDAAALDGAVCEDGEFCSVDDRCASGVCAGGARDCSAAGDQCNDGICDEIADSCSAQPRLNGTTCDDGDQCTIADVCAGGLCAGDPMTCGDGITQTTCGETCDDGNLADGDGCDSNCTATACGNGVVTDGEECDDGGVVDGDGCSTACVVEPGWTCEGRLSVCQEVCGDGIVTPGEDCDDGNLDGRDGCSSNCGWELCRPEPSVGCRRPVESAKALVVLKDKTPSDRDMLTWKWMKGTQTLRAEFGRPDRWPSSGGTGYAICIYDQSGGAPRLRLSALAPAGGYCAGKPCWREKKTGFAYKDKELDPHGVMKITLKEGEEGKAKIIFKGKGPDLAIPDLSTLSQPVTVQLMSSEGLCWEAIYSTPALKQDAGQFKDKAD